MSGHSTVGTSHLVGIEPWPDDLDPEVWRRADPPPYIADELHRQPWRHAQQPAPWDASAMSLDTCAFPVVELPLEWCCRQMRMGDETWWAYYVNDKAAHECERKQQEEAERQERSDQFFRDLFWLLFTHGLWP